MELRGSKLDSIDGAPGLTMAINGGSAVAEHLVFISISVQLVYALLYVRDMHVYAGCPAAVVVCQLMRNDGFVLFIYG